MDRKVYILSVCLLQAVYSLPLFREPGLLPACSDPFFQAGKHIIECVIMEGEVLDYRELREWTAMLETNDKVHVSLECVGGAVFLPLPYRARNVLSLRVHGCEVLGLFSEWNQTNVIPDELEYLEITDVVIQTSIRDVFERVMNIANYTSDFECGQRTLKYELTRNVRYDFKINMEDFDIYLQIMAHDPNQLFIQNRPKNNKCVFPYLRYLENSGNHNMAKLHFKILEDSSQYPALEDYDLSNNSFTKIPMELRNIDYRLFPKLKSINFSKNRIRSIDIKFPTKRSTQNLIVIDLTDNMLDTIPASIVDELIRNPNVIIDVRSNPLKCDCSLMPFRRYMISRYAKRKFHSLRDVTCQVKRQQGTSVFRLLDNQFGSLFC